MIGLTQIFLVFSGLILLTSCQQNIPEAAKDPLGAAAKPSPEANTLQEIVGYVLKCDTTKGPAFVYAFSPHIFGIWENLSEKTLEYFSSQFITKNAELVYESFLIGKPDMRVTPKKLGDPKNRRFLIKFQKGKVHFLVAHGIDPKSKQPLNPTEYICLRDQAISNSFSETSTK